MTRTLPLILATLAVGACAGEEMSTREIEAAAIAEARERLSLGNDVPLETTVWVGSEEIDGDVAFCGTVSGQQQGMAIQPMRFLAAGDPPQWRVFENAHNPMVVTKRADEVVDWARYCGGGR